MEREPQHNGLGQPVGGPLDGWSPRPRPPRTLMIGRFAAVDGRQRRRLADLRSGAG